MYDNYTTHLGGCYPAWQLKVKTVCCYGKLGQLNKKGLTKADVEEKSSFFF
jgi:hypothetical protein